MIALYHRLLRSMPICSRVAAWFTTGCSSNLADFVGVTDLPAELSRCFLLIQELDQKSTSLQAEIDNRCRKHVTYHAAEHEVASF